MSTPHSGLVILKGPDVDAILSTLDLDKAISSQAAVFDAFSASSSAPSDGIASIQNPHRVTIETDQSTCLFMPARVADLGGSTCKIVSVPKASAGPSEAGLPAVTVVLDDKGVVRGLVNARKLTAMRNACGSTLFLRRYAAAESIRTCVFFGSGEQIYAHASVFFKLYESIQSCNIVVRSENARATSLLKRLKNEHPQIDLQLQDQSTNPTALDAIVNKADVIVAATSSQVALFPCSAVRPGARIILIGSYKPHMREVDDELIKRASKIVVDSKKTCLQEAGELISSGVKEEELEELGGESGARNERTGEDIIIFKSVGLGVQDVAIANLVLDEAIRLGAGTRIDGFD